MSRLKEPSTWASMAGIWLAAAQYIPVDVLPRWFAVSIAALSAVAGVVMRESGGVVAGSVETIKQPSVTVVNANVQARGQYGND